MPDRTRLTCSLIAEVDEGFMNTNQDGSSLPIEPGEDRRSEAEIVDDWDFKNSQVHGIDVSQDDDSSARPPGRTLEEILIELSRKVPQEEWDRLPADLIDRLDFYTSGADV